jgi:predicted GNAT family acetyltransferase
MPSAAVPQVVDNPKRSRFQIVIGGKLARLDYLRDDQRLELTHTVVPKDIEGRGHGTALVRFALEQARREQLAVVPTCGFVRAFLRKHPEYADLVRDG